MFLFFYFFIFLFFIFEVVGVAKPPLRALDRLVCGGRTIPRPIQGSWEWFRPPSLYSLGVAKLPPKAMGWFDHPQTDHGGGYTTPLFLKIKNLYSFSYF
jgi:hypothetical protein